MQRNSTILSISVALIVALPLSAKADFVITSAILEFTSKSPKLQDIELVSRSAKESDYIVSEISEVIHPGQPDEARHVVDADASRILVTPEKTILPAGARKIVRFVSLKEPDNEEHIYRVAIKPIINGVEQQAKVGLKVLVGYEVLVIIRPSKMTPSYEAARRGTVFAITNHGNTNILFQNGKQCEAEEKCKLPPAVRVYPGQSTEVTLPLDKPITYSIWDGATNLERPFE